MRQNMNMNKWISVSSWLMEIEKMKRMGVAEKRCLLPKLDNIVRKNIDCKLF